VYMGNSFINKNISIFFLCALIFVVGCSNKKVSVTAEFSKAIAGAIIAGDKGVLRNLLLHVIQA